MSLPGRWRWRDRPIFCELSIRETALATLIHQRRLTPSCGGQAPTAERTVGPARMIAESLTPKPGIREQYRHKADIPRCLLDVRFRPQADIEGSKIPHCSSTRRAIPFIRKAGEVLLSETPRVHHAARRRGRVAGCGTRAASRADAADRRAHEHNCGMIRKSSPALRYSCKYSLSSRESDLPDPCQPTAYLCPKAEDGNRRKSVVKRARE